MQLVIKSRFLNNML